MEEKAKELLRQLDISYYGERNKRVGSYTPTEEFYIRLKVHDYLSMYDYDHNHIYHGFVNVKWIDADTSDHSEPDSSSASDSSKPNPCSRVDTSSKLSSITDSSKPDEVSGKWGDVNNDGVIDIEDAVAIIQQINGLTLLKADEEKRADVSKDNAIDIDDAVMIISYINGNSTF